MISNSDIKKVLGYAILIFVIYSSSGSSDFSNSKGLLIGGLIFFSFVYFYYENYIKLTFIKLIALFIGISVLYYILNGAYDEVTHLGFFMKIILAYYCRDLLKENFADYYIDIMYKWACICLFLYCIQLVAFEPFFNLNNFFGVDSEPFSKSNSIVFTMTHIHAKRNCGFMWEPGAYAAMLVIVFYINLFYKKEPLFSTRNSIFLISMLTTQSTMVILVLLVPFILLFKDFIMRDRLYQQISIFIIPAAVVALIVIFFKVDFLYSKIAYEISTIDEELEYLERGKKENYQAYLSRTGSLLLHMQTIQEYPLLGVGVDMRTTGVSKIDYFEYSETSTGITLFIMRFGFIGFFIYNWLFYKKALFERTDHKIGWVVMLNMVLFAQEISLSSHFHLFVF